ncbi:decapping enzyme-like protein [Sesamum angolense]|uniref:Decapping enzyme-like protein n=1 Tax=Sesamum angolense TaxID=2727404 RepID=A0AAE2C469_9LAMI|nr:decapping enzyme-like protein [Sesamum angolense]
MSHNGKLMPNLDEKSTKLLNLTVLQRIDPFVEEILITAAHVTSTNLTSILANGNTQPRFQFIVMNRRNTDNLVENLLGDFEYEVQVPYLLYEMLLKRILNAYSKVPTKSKVSPTKSDFEELEAVPTLAVMDGPLEPSSSTTSSIADVPDDRSFVNFFSVCFLSCSTFSDFGRLLSNSAYEIVAVLTAMNIGSAPNVAIAGQPYHSSATAVSAHPQSALPTLPSAQAPATLSTSTPIMSILDNPEANAATKRSTDLVKPSSFFGPHPSSSPLIMPAITSSVPTAPPLNPPGNVQRPYGAPLLQPFPPPTPPPSLTPTSVPTPNYGPVISREKVREALQILVQDNQFIDMVYQAVLNAHNHDDSGNAGGVRSPLSTH